MLLAKLSAKWFAANQAFLSISNIFDLLREVVLTNWYGVQFLESSSSLNGDSRGHFLTFLTLCTPVDDMDCILQLNGDGRSFRLSCLAPFLCPTTLCRVGEKKHLNFCTLYFCKKRESNPGRSKQAQASASQQIQGVIVWWVLSSQWRDWMFCSNWTKLKFRSESWKTVTMPLILEISSYNGFGSSSSLMKCIKGS